MRVKPEGFFIKDLLYVVRSAIQEDAKSLSEVRLQIDGETENLDRVQGENYIDELGFRQIIKNDTDSVSNLFLVAEVNDRIVGFARCEGNNLKRISHKVEFGVCVLKQFWGCGIGRNLLNKSLFWADSNGIKKVTLNVLEENDKAIKLYTSFGFEIEGILKNDKILSDGKYYNTIVMGRFEN